CGHSPPGAPADGWSRESRCYAAATLGTGLLLDLPIGVQSLSLRGLELAHHGLVSLHRAELRMTHHEYPDRRSARYGGRRGVELHHADLTKKVMRAQATPVLAAHRYVDHPLQDHEEPIVPRPLGDQHGSSWNADLLHLASQELQVSGGEA